MQKRIFLNFAGLILVFFTFLALSFGVIFFNAVQSREKNVIRDKARLVAGLFNQGDFDYGTTRSETRITVIAPGGATLYDSNADADLSENRGNRAEVISAFETGRGEAIRRSDTLGTDTFYYALRLDNGNVIRFSRALYSLRSVVTSIIPALAVITAVLLLAAYYVTHRLTRRIVEPLLSEDFESSVYDELIPYIRKIDRQKNKITGQMKKLRKRSETIDAIISNMREGLVLIDKKGTVITANKSAHDIFNISGENGMVEKNIREIHRDPEFMGNVKKGLKGGYAEMPFRRKEKIYNVVFNPVTNGEYKRGAIIIFIDATSLHKAELQRKEFTANVSHELKTPLTTISALSEMLENGMAKPEDVADFSSKISEHTKRLIYIIDDIIQLSEFDEDKTDRNFDEFDIYALAQSVTAALREKAEKKSVTIELTGQPLIIKGNRRLLDELMYNLVDNGIKYNKENGTVTLSVAEEYNHCKITVSDTGIGIPPEHQARVFERFYRVDSSRSKKTGGTGLGLSIVKHITEHHNGKITLESTEGEGTTVVCHIKVSSV